MLPSSISSSTSPKTLLSHISSQKATIANRSKKLCTNKRSFSSNGRFSRFSLGNALLKYICVLFACIRCASSSLLIGALFPAEPASYANGVFINGNGNGNGVNISIESDEEIVFKHAVYVSNQYKLSFLNTLPTHPTLLHKIIHVSKIDHLRTMKKGERIFSLYNGVNLFINLNIHLNN
jgi:hypothetical protein